MLYGQLMFLLWYFQEVIESQEKTIINLLKAVQEQHDQLDNQKSKIKNLEDKVIPVICDYLVWYLELCM